MSIDCHCHPNHYECPVLYFGQARYPVPSIPSITIIVDEKYIYVDDPMNQKIYIHLKGNYGVMP